MQLSSFDGVAFVIGRFSDAVCRTYVEWTTWCLCRTSTKLVSDVIAWRSDDFRVYLAPPTDTDLNFTPLPEGVLA